MQLTSYGNADDNGIVAVKTTSHNNGVIISHNIEKRNKWLWVGLAAGGAIISTAAVVTGIWAPIFVAGTFGKIIMSLLASLSLAATIAGIVGAVTANNKREANYAINKGDYITTLQNGDQLFMYEQYGYVDHTVKRAQEEYPFTRMLMLTVNGTTENSKGYIYAESQHGNHTMVSAHTYGLANMLGDLTWMSENDCYGDCYLQHIYGVNNMTSKRNQYYDVNWASYNYYVNTMFYITEERGSDWLSVTNALNEAYANNDDPDTWKYCMCVDYDTDGQYYEIPSEESTNGEIYFNTYGGIDGYCSNSYCGAQCNDIGC